MEKAKFEKRFSIACELPLKAQLNLEKSKQSKWVAYLTEKAEEFLLKNYQLSLTIPIEISNQLSTCLGYFQHIGRKPLKITMSGKLLQLTYLIPDEELETNLTSIIDVLYHECTHYALFILGKDFDDGAEDFENALAQFGVSSSATTKGATKLPTYYTPFDIFESIDGEQVFYDFSKTMYTRYNDKVYKKKCRVIGKSK